ncbi:MAG TPA: MFS transporter, partial [Gaiellaceae bacterium]|nr:MFS transporter [Gaiellaceae bacterium]
MFLLPSIFLGIAFALLLGGKPSRLLSVEFRHGWTVFAALGLQVVLFSGARDLFPPALHEPLHLSTYALLFTFAFVNVRHLALLPLFLGMALNAIAITANGGSMPVKPDAWEAAGLGAGHSNNVEVGADRLAFLGDVFALPQALPLTNVFSIGDLLIGIGCVVFIVAISTSEGSRRILSPSRLVEPLRIPSFRRLVVGKLVSQLGDWLTLAALIGWIYHETGSLGQVALLLLVRLAPPIVGSGLAAALVDSFPRQRLLVFVEVVRGVLVAVALVSVLLTIHPLAFAAIAGSGLLAAISSATTRALVPSILRRDQFAAGNAALGFAQDGAMALGALGAGIALTAASAATALAIDLVTFVVAAFLYAGVRALPVPTAQVVSARGLLDGVRYVARRRILLVVILSFGAATVATGLTNATLPRFLGSELGLGPGAYGFGLAALAGGLALGGAVTG